MTRMSELRIEKMLSFGCCVCAWIGIANAAAEVHHILDSGRRMGDWHTLALCSSHHRGTEWSEAIPQKYRLSLAGGRKAFARVLPTEQELWMWTQERLV